MAAMLFLTDGAFLAREKARADAECYTAMKIAEANKVFIRHRPGPLVLGTVQTEREDGPCVEKLIVSLKKKKENKLAVIMTPCYVCKTNAVTENQALLWWAPFEQ